ncbi:PTS sugar transporter subunit IIA [Enorma phocaeensis]|uniref:PTS sugar transporter subunit IIA n=1 Tax=Enorma phocaeensis TaxID=1871019 RepID=UPI00195E9324|nr:PTS sugar transporter subunit IIA [Enorma phocaeensis]MBM6953601.1 PTS sugar transporter subunit IIA [Enorma phocaeensis]
MIKILLTSHGTMAEGMVQSVKMLIGEQEHLEVVTFAEEMGAEELEELYAQKLSDTSDDNQWLVFCDLKGGTPFNVVSKFSFKNENVAVIYGMNLPVVIEALVLSAPQELSLNELVDDIVGKTAESIGLSEI